MRGTLQLYTIVDYTRFYSLSRMFHVANYVTWPNHKISKQLSRNANEDKMYNAIDAPFATAICGPYV